MNHLSDERLADFSHKEQLLPREELEFIYEKLDYCDPSRVSEMTLLILTSLNLTKPPSSHHAVTEAVDYVRTLIYIVTDRDIEASRRQCAITTLDTLYKYFSEAATAMKENELQQHVAALDNPKLEPEVRIQTENQCAALDIIWHSWAVVFLVLGARLGNLYEKYWDVADKENKVVTALKQLKFGGKATDLTRGQTQKEIENYTELREMARDELHDLGCDWWECIHSIRLAQQEYERLMKSYKLAIEAYRNLQWEAQAKDSSMDFDSPVPPTFPLESNHKLRAHTKSWFQAKERGMVEREAMQPQSQSSSSKRSSGSRRLDVPGPTIIITDENGENFHLRNELPFEAQHEVLEWEKKRSDANSRMRIRMTTPEPDEEICFSGIPVASVPLEELLAVNENNDKKWGYLEEEKPVRSPTLPYNYSSVLEEVLSHEISMEDEWLDYLPARPESRHDRYAQGEQSTDDSFPIASEPEPLFGPDGEILMEDFHSASLLNTVPGNFGKVPLVKKVSPQALGTVAKAVGRKFQQVFPNGQEYDGDPQTSDTEDNDESDCTNSASGTSKSHGEDPGSVGVYGRDKGDPDDGSDDSDDKHEKDGGGEFGDGDGDGESTEEDRMEEYTEDDERADDETHLDLYWPSTTHRIHQYMDTTYAPTNNIIQLFEAMKIGSHNNLQPKTLSHYQSKLFQNRCRNIRSNIPLLRRRIPNLPWHVRYPVKKPLRILDRRLGEEDSFGYLTREHYIYRLVEWARDSLCHPSNAAKYAIILRESQGRFSEETDNIEYEGPPIESESK